MSVYPKQASQAKASAFIYESPLTGCPTQISWSKLHFTSLTLNLWLL